MDLIFPTDFVLLSRLRLPIFFLIGPCLGGGDWQMGATLGLERRLGGQCTVVNPSWYAAGHPLLARRAESQPGLFEDSNAWERYYIELAIKTAEQGCAVCWYPRESTAQPRDDGQPYARDSYGEVGELRGRKMCDPGIRFVVGIEEGFPGESVMRKNFNRALGRDFVVHSTLDATLNAAVEAA